MIFGVWWGFWLLGLVAVFCLFRSIHSMLEGTRPQD